MVAKDVGRSGQGVWTRLNVQETLKRKRKEEEDVDDVDEERERRPVESDINEMMNSV